jgi:hypothetical protein
MRKLLMAISLLAIMVVPLFGADQYYAKYAQTVQDSQWIAKGEGHYLTHYIDSVTIHAKYGDTLLNIGVDLYNARIRAKNPATDSGYIKLGVAHGLFHTDSVARNLDWRTLGLATGGAVPDTFWLYFGGVTLPKLLYIRPVVGGDHDSTTIIFVEGWR